jgi:hypothetical protein
MRETGFYRVKRYGEWQIAFYIKEGESGSGEWYLSAFMDREAWHSDAEFDAIDENRIDPNPKRK